MRHDPALAAVPPACPDPRRVLEIEVWSHYIDSVLATAPEVLPFDAARRLVKRLESSGAAQVRRRTVTTQILLIGISASTDGTDYALLRTWQNAAIARLLGGRA